MSRWMFGEGGLLTRERFRGITAHKPNYESHVSTTGASTAHVYVLTESPNMCRYVHI